MRKRTKKCLKSLQGKIALLNFWLLQNKSFVYKNNNNLHRSLLSIACAMGYPIYLYKQFAT